MKTGLVISVFILCMVSASVYAERFLCPVPVRLPQTLHLEGASKGNLTLVQAYLDNLKRITDVYKTKTREAQRNELTNCLMGHLITLPETAALQNPSNQQDAVTLSLLKTEVEASLLITRRNLRFKPELPFVETWLAQIPTRP
jgi:hypothetical protein